MKKLGFIFLTVGINFVIILTLLYFFVWSKLIYIEAGANVNKELSLNTGAIVVDQGSTITGKISLHEGKILFKENSHIFGDIRLMKGDIIIEKGTEIKGNIVIDQGNLTLAENVKIQGDIQLGKGEMQKHSTAFISGNKPPLFVTYDWPEALWFFDSLPQKHKDDVGFIFLTKENNITIRDEHMIKPADYFEGIYYYKDQKLLSIDVQNDPTAKPFFDNAAKFFRELPERRLGPFSVGATTKTYANNSQKADIYIPVEGSKYTFIHEMGHVVDFKNDFSDLHQPIYPYVSKEVALNGYGATHPGEDFAEAYKYYVTTPEYFFDLIRENPERQQKYDFMKKYVFADKEYFS